MTNLEAYQKFMEEKAKMDEASQYKKKAVASKISYFQLSDKDPTYRFRILPSKIEGQVYIPIYRYRVHFNFLDPNKNKASVFTCLHDTGKCLMCERAFEIYNIDKDEGKRKFAVNSYDMYVYDVDKKQFGIFTLTNKKCFEMLTTVMGIALGQNIPLATREHGVVLTITKQGKGVGAAFNVGIAANDYTLPEDAIKAFDEAVPLNKRRQMTNEDMEKILRGELWGWKLKDMQKPEQRVPVSPAVSQINMNTLNQPAPVYYTPNPPIPAQNVNVQQEQLNQFMQQSPKPSTAQMSVEEIEKLLK